MHKKWNSLPTFDEVNDHIDELYFKGDEIKV